MPILKHKKEDEQLMAQAKGRDREQVGGTRKLSIVLLVEETSCNIRTEMSSQGHRK